MRLQLIAARAQCARVAQEIAKAEHKILQMQDAPFRPQISQSGALSDSALSSVAHSVCAGVESVLKVQQDPDGFLLRLQEKTRAAEERRRRVAAEGMAKEVTRSGACNDSTAR